MSGLKSSLYLSLLLSLIFSLPVIAAELSSSTIVQANKTLLLETKSCPQCDLSGADLNRLDLSGANLEGANLSRAKMALTNLSGANLKGSDLREAVLNGADLAEIDLRGADLTGASMVGAYMSGALMDGEMIEASTYAGDKGLQDVTETVYVEDTAKPKALPDPDEMMISNRRDFEATPPPVPMNGDQNGPVASTQGPQVTGDVSLAHKNDTLPRQSVAAPEAKAAPAIEEVRIEDVVEEKEIIIPDNAAHDEPVSEKLDQENIEKNGVEEGVDIDEAFADDREPEGIRVEDIALVVVDTEEKSSPANQADTLANVDETPGGNEIAVSESSDFAAEKNNGKEIAPVEQEVGIVESMLSVFSREEPSTEVMKNIANLLDENSCYGCDLSGVDLSGKNLDGADLEGANLSNSVLQGADLEGANLKGTNLSGADLRGADLSEADLYKAVLRDADLTDAKLENTLLDDVDLSEAKGYMPQSVMMKQN